MGIFHEIPTIQRFWDTPMTMATEFLASKARLGLPGGSKSSTI
jgi:hypothetical protein